MSDRLTEIAPCAPTERGAALEALYRRVPASARPGAVLEVLRQTEAGALDLSGLWVARRRSRIIGAMLTQSLAGRSAAIWPPEVGRCWDASAVASALVRSALEHYRAAGFRLAQALVEAGSPRRAAADLARGGLPYITDLIYLGRPTAEPLPIDPSTPRFCWRPFGPDLCDAFARVLQQTYVGSLDMPELEGIRSLDDVLASHRAGGQFDPGRWWLGRLPAEPSAAAVVLLSSADDGGPWEVSYLGLTPPARGRGLGRAALAFALELARPHAGRLELAVDARNHPADRLYRRAGFRPFDRRGVHVATLMGRVAEG